MKIKKQSGPPEDLIYFDDDLPLSQSQVEDVVEIFKTPLTGSYNWDYTVADNRIKKLYELGKELNWNGSIDLNWDYTHPADERILETDDELPHETLEAYENLSDAKWKGRILVRSSSNAYNQALMSSLYANLGEKAVTEWSSKVVSNFARDPKGNDRDQVKAIAAGQGDIAIVNSYYIGLLLSSEKQADVDAANSVSVFFPNQGDDERGAHINISAFAMTKNAPNKENAIKLLEYLTGEEAQNTYMNNSYEYPANPRVKPSKIVQSWGEFKRDSLDLNALGLFREKAIKVFDNTGWK